jgi:threonine dehydratase
VIGVEPETADDAARSFRSGTVQRVHDPPTVADGLRTPSLGRITWPLVRQHVHDFRTVGEAEIAAAMNFLWTRCKLVTEPSAAVAVAPLLRSAREWAGLRVGVILSGGNVEMAAACALLAASGPEEET